MKDVTFGIGANFKGSDDTELWLLMNGAEARGMYLYDHKQSITPAFTTVEKANRFIPIAKSLNMFTDINGIFQTTFGEFYGWVEQGKAEGQLAIDPDAEILKHPAFRFYNIQNYINPPDSLN